MSVDFVLVEPQVPALEEVPPAHDEWRAAADAEQQRRVRDVLAAEQRLFTAHLGSFDRARRPVVPAPPGVDALEVLQTQTEAVVTPVSRFDRRARRAAVATARRLADEQVSQRRSARLAEWQRAQDEADRCWEAQARHEPAAVVAALDHAFADSVFPTAAVEVWTEAGVRGVTMVVTVGPPSLVPDRTVVTGRGGERLAVRSPHDVNTCYLRAIGSAVLATVRRTLATCATVEELCALVVRSEPGSRTHGVLFAGGFQRLEVRNWDWADLDPAATLLIRPGAQIQLRGANEQVAALDLADLPLLRDLVAALDLATPPTESPAGETPPPPDLPVDPGRHRRRRLRRSARHAGQRRP
ncbi:MAG: hypothetical protein ACRDO1_07050 [Nocardioidaceae bacterium]